MKETQTDTPFWKYHAVTPDGSGYKLTLNQQESEIFGLTEDRRQIKVTTEFGTITLELVK